MVQNDSFSMSFSSPGALHQNKKTIGEIFTDSNSLTPSNIMRIIRKEHDKITSILRFHPPSPSQYQYSLVELICLYEKVCEQSMDEYRNLILAIFLKLCANILTVQNKSNHQQTLYQLSQIIANTIETSSEDAAGLELKKWANRIILETDIHLQKFTDCELDLEFNSGTIIDELSLSRGNLHFLRSSIFESAREVVRNLPTNVKIDRLATLKSENVGDEELLQLLLWWNINDDKLLNGEFLNRLLPNILSYPDPENIVKCGMSILDVKLYLAMLACVASSTSESGMRVKSIVQVASDLYISKIQQECWKAVVEHGRGRALSATSRLRLSQLIDSVRLINGGSEDVRVLFEAWKGCLQPSAAHDDVTYQAIHVIREIYRNKMNNLLIYGPFYQRISEMKPLFPLQFDYEFVDTTEAEHIGVVINSIEGFGNSKQEMNEEEDSFATASERYSDLNVSDNSQFFSPMKHNRMSMMPESIGTLIREESAVNYPTISTKSVILTPSREGRQSPSVLNLSIDSRNSSTYWPETTKSLYFDGLIAKDDVEDVDEDDVLEVALKESVKRHEESIMEIKNNAIMTPKKDVGVETDDISYSSSSNNSILKQPEVPGICNDQENEDLTTEFLAETTKMLKNHWMRKVGKRNIENWDSLKTDEEILEIATEKMEKIYSDLGGIIQRLEKTKIMEGNEHDPEKCIGCQSDEKQEMALRQLEKMALEWDEQGNCDLTRMA